MRVCVCVCVRVRVRETNNKINKLGPEIQTSQHLSLKIYRVYMFKYLNIELIWLTIKIEFICLTIKI